MVVSGAALLVSGILLYSSFEEGEDSDGDGVDEYPDGDVECILGGCLIAGALAAAGAGLIVGGLVWNPAEPTPPPTPIAAATTPTVIGAPGRPLALQRPLPEVEVDGQTLRLAKQVRSAVLRADCTAAQQTLRVIHTRDSQYHRALIASSVVDGCR